MSRTIALLVDELPRDGRCLEIGIGTGRIALPLIRHGVDVVGADLSREMMLRLRENAGDAVVPLVQADATRLPFRTGAFTSALASHVLHLIPHWREAVDELIRVVRPGGLLIVLRGARGRTRDQGVREDDPWHQRIRRRFFVEAGNPSWPPGLDSMDELDERMKEVASVHELPELMEEGTSTINELMRALEEGWWAACWSIDEQTRKSAAATARAWAEREYGDLDERRPTLGGSTWRAYRLTRAGAAGTPPTG